jgi:hypothetical protein
MMLIMTSVQVHAIVRDPTQPAYPTITETPIVSSKDEPRLSAIWITAKNRWATINGIQAREGQTISGNIKVIQIRNNSITINQNGSIKTLYLLQRSYQTQ